MQWRRVILIVLDSVGIGAAPDAHLYGDEGSDTLGNIAKHVSDFCLPAMNALGLHMLNESYRASCSCLPSRDNLIGSFGILNEKSVGKDTTTGHWELSGIVLSEPFPVYPNGFPKSIMKAFSHAIGRGAIGNIAASGTEIIETLGKEHMDTGKLIVYTSADSVFQIAAHEEVVPLETLYEYCQVARKLLVGEHAVSRVIARPFLGSPGSFYRTTNRKDFSLTPPADTVLDHLAGAGHSVIGIGKIADIFNGKGVTESVKTKGNAEGISKTVELIQKCSSGLIFTNLIDFDMLYGHRNNPEGYAQAMEEFDINLPIIMDAMADDDILMITADHGCDPTNTSTDHTREYVPLLVYGKRVKAGVNLGIRQSFADVAATIAENFSLEPPQWGSSFMDRLYE
jgi:phosphopentomutase